jgi:hypothetical protein
MTMSNQTKENLNDDVTEEKLKDVPIKFLSQDNPELSAQIEEQLAKVKRLNIRIGFIDASISQHLEQKRLCAKEIEFGLESGTLMNEKRQEKFNTMRSFQVNTASLIEKMTVLIQELATEEKALESLFITPEV